MNIPVVKHNGFCGHFRCLLFHWIAPFSEPRISLTVLLGHVPSDEKNHRQIHDGVEDEDRSQANAGNGAGEQWTNSGAEHTDARQQPEAAAPPLLRNDPMSGAERQRQRAAGK